MEAVRHAVGEGDPGDGLAGDVARVEDPEVARVPRLVVGQDAHPAVVLGRRRRTRDEDRLADAVAATEAARDHRAPLQVVLSDRGPDRLRALVLLGLARGRVPEAVLQADPALVDARELRDDVVEWGRPDAALAEIDAPAVHARRPVVAVVQVLDALAGHEVETPVARPV